MTTSQHDLAVDPTLVELNHASFGAPTRAALARAQDERARIERDTARGLGPDLTVRLREQARALEALVGADPGSLALTANSTEGHGALTASLPLAAGDHVLLADLEYASVLRGWQVACERVGATADVVPLALPATADQVLATVAAMHPATRVVVLSAITSSTALALPVREVAAICRERGVTLVVDAAHVVGHAPLDVADLGADAVLGSLHKWLPVPRAVGFLWLAPHLRDRVRPAVVSLAWDSEDLVERFGWRGTWDPAPALGLGAAIAEHDAWRAAGDLDRAVELADRLSETLTGLGLRATGTAELVPRRLRAFLVDGVTLPTLRAALDGAGVRAWTGTAPDGTTLLRVSTHVHTAPGDDAALAAGLRTARRSHEPLPAPGAPPLDRR
ncbi:aminotransferase class V-fold PLP-dependent enzyme [Isoptericola sp. b441]|uniref:Aminotransferase class V-fold PLP-dependent enzyme n=1 Tax=Actinotalea lenta TaxID=3064654 RepID=A0ABT9D7A0_9CELL|nr:MULTISPECIES: aminotransferase class V-fold PLP-dependent enzyme [unclassified Isoptericola]MDO8106728.1 aminotransferase class V-fold PLP-dependent enzyme [Isoptericola sp. b441]MDO8121560.1 aminotransferase class V-fold PLP-dependent enzyme [Isoptericola sp. b490]